MPVSTGVLISSALTEIVRLNPRSVLDAGCGFGLWGFLSRLYLDVFPGRRYREEWQVRIEAIEVFPKYIMPHQKFIYDEIHIGKIEEIVDRLDAFDLYIFGDVLEHLEKDVGIRVLETACRKTNKGVLINIPLGGGWCREAPDENVYEAHLSAWELEDFAPHWPKVCAEATFPDVGQYATILISEGLSRPDKAEVMYRNGVLCSDRHLEFATGCLRRAIETGYSDPSAHFELSRLLLESHNVEEAVEILRDAIARFPDHAPTYDLLGQLLRRLNRADEADQVLAAKPTMSNTS
jgi:tetratricopeptide (TPR) repeat protein